MGPVNKKGQKDTTDNSKTRTAEAREKQRLKMQKFRKGQREDPERLEHQRAYDRERKRKERGSKKLPVMIGSGFDGDLVVEDSRIATTDQALDKPLDFLKSVCRFRISEELATFNNSKNTTIWGSILDAEDLEITAKEARQIEKSPTPGKDFYDKLADLGFTARQLVDLITKHGFAESSGKVQMYINGQQLSKRSQSLNSVLMDNTTTTTRETDADDSFQGDGSKGVIQGLFEDLRKRRVMPEEPETDSSQPEPEFFARKLEQPGEPIQNIFMGLSCSSGTSTANITRDENQKFGNGNDLPVNVDTHWVQAPSTNRQMTTSQSSCINPTQGPCVGINSTNTATQFQPFRPFPSHNEHQNQHLQIQQLTALYQQEVNHPRPQPMSDTNTDLIKRIPSNEYRLSGLDILGGAASDKYGKMALAKDGLTYPSNSKPRSLWNASFERTHTENIARDHDVHYCMFLPDGRFIYGTNFTDRKIVLMDRNLSQTLSRHKIKSWVYDICVMSNTEVIITHKNQNLQFINVLTNELTLGEKIDLGDDVTCYSIDVLKGEIYIVCEVATCVYVRILDRLLLSIFEFEYEEHVKIKVGKSGDKIFLSFGESSKIVCLSIVGHVLFTFPNDKTGRYGNEFQEPIDMYVDDNEDVLVSCCGSGKIHLIISDGTQYKELIEAQEASHSLFRCFSYRESDGCLVVERDGELLVYKASW